MAEPDCQFCRKLAVTTSQPPDDLIWEFSHSVAFLGTWQYYAGYCVLVSRRHAHELHELEHHERMAFLDEMCQLARAIHGAFRPQKLNYELLGNQVPHLHWHIFPRFADDSERLKPVWMSIERAEQDPARRALLESGPSPRAVIRTQLRDTLTTLVGAA